MAVDNNDCKVFPQRWILKSVIHHDDIGATGAGCCCDGNAVARHNGGCKPRQQQRLVADLCCVMVGGIHQDRTAEPAAVAAAEEERPRVRGEKEPPHCERRWCLAPASDREVTEANDWNAGIAATRAHAPPRYRAVDRR